ncbi:MAG: glycosyltransferase family 2 protein [Acidimicrobiales bacterium]
MSLDRVSVVTPVFNRPDLVVEAVESVLDQAGVEVEVVVVDDGSTDDTPEVVDRLARDPRVRALHQPNRGPAAARNAGVAVCSAPWLTFLDSDDLMLSGRLRRQLDVLADTSRASAVIGLGRIQVDPGVELPVEIAGRAPDDREASPYTISMLLARSLFDELGGFDESLRVAEDSDFHARLVAAGHRVHKLDEPLFVRRITGDNLIYGIDHRREMFDLIRRRRPGAG